MLDLYKNIRALRLEKKMTQTELAEKTGYTNKSSIASIEAGKVDLPLSKIKEFAKALDTTASDLMGWDEIHEEIAISAKEDAELISAFHQMDAQNKKHLLAYANYLLSNNKFE